LGNLQESETVFHNAEEIQKEFQPRYPYLYSLQGFLYFELLMTQERYPEAYTRAIKIREIMTNNLLLDTSLGHLALGQTYFLKKDATDLGTATNSLGKAVDNLRLAGRLDFLPRGLLARSRLHWIKGEFKESQTDLDEAMSIAQRGSMGLYEADCYLEYARLYLARGEGEKARENWERAKGMIERMGYHRRDRDVREIEEQLQAAGG
jgi:tetratricopeptide (TPR) repeat protein